MVRVYYMQYPLRSGAAWVWKNDEKKYTGILMREIQREAGLSAHVSKSHCPGWAVICRALGPVGCDVERVREDWEKNSLEKRLGFYLREEEIRAVMEAERPAEAAVLAWTRKESYFKACQTRKTPEEVSMADSRRVLYAGGKKLVTLRPAEGVILTCCADAREEVLWEQKYVKSTIDMRCKEHYSKDSLPDITGRGAYGNLRKETCAMMKNDVKELLMDQVNKEFYSAYLYLDFANFFKNKGLDGFYNWFYVQAQEERDHANLFIQYLQNNNIAVELKDIPSPKDKLEKLMDPLTAALKHEEYVTALINHIYDAAQNAKDFRTLQFLDWFVKEQGEEEKNSQDLITKMELFGGDAKSLYMLDNELKARVYAAPTLVL